MAKPQPDVSVRMSSPGHESPENQDKLAEVHFSFAISGCMCFRCTCYGFLVSLQ